VTIPLWRWLAAAGLALLLVQAVAWGRWALSVPGSALASTSHGYAVAGGLSLGRSLAPVGSHHRVSATAAALGRQYVHGDLGELLVVAMGEERASSEGQGRSTDAWRIAETGWRAGGWFPPHLLHHDGLSVDLRMPDADGPARLARLFDAFCRQGPTRGLLPRILLVEPAIRGQVRGNMRSTCRQALIDWPVLYAGQVHVTFLPKAGR